MTSNSKIETAISQAKASADVDSFRIWQDRRVYITFIGNDRNYRGCALNFFYDLSRDGWFWSMSKGSTPRGFMDHVEAFAAEVGATRE